MGRSLEQQQYFNMDVFEKFEFWLDRSINDSGCWIWKGPMQQKGYGRLSHKKKSYQSHRLSYMYFNGVDLTPDQCVCHKCDNPPCFNPDHLFIGSLADNVYDMVNKNRHGWPDRRGAQIACSVLKDEDIPIIRRLYKEGIYQKDIAKMFGVGKSTIGSVLSGHTWGHIK